MMVATIPIGYNEGYPRVLSNRGSVLISGARCRILGHVTMDQIVVDVSRVKNVHLGMPVTIVGEEKGKVVTLDDLAPYAGTINYEFACSLGNRLPRVFF
jgi:alanine racemase